MGTLLHFYLRIYQEISGIEIASQTHKNGQRITVLGISLLDFQMQISLNRNRID